MFIDSLPSGVQGLFLVSGVLGIDTGPIPKRKALNPKP